MEGDYEHTKCRTCGARNKPLFAMPIMKDKEDFFCDGCRLAELEKRATAE